MDNEVKDINLEQDSFEVILTEIKDNFQALLNRLGAMSEDLYNNQIAEIKQDLADVTQQLQLALTTGIPKLVTYPYYIPAETDGQTVFTIPYEYLNLNTDTISVTRNGIDIPDDSYTITLPVENPDKTITKGYITLDKGISIGSYVKVKIWKNVPVGDNGAVDGQILAEGSTPMNRIIGLPDMSARVDDLEKDVFNSTKYDLSLFWGMNPVVKYTDNLHVTPKFEIQGKTLINLLGSMGNCEDTSKWVTYNSTLSLDTANKVFGGNSIKVTSTNATSSNVYVDYTNKLDRNKYYAFSCYVKNGNFTNGFITAVQIIGTGLSWKTSSVITDSTKFSRVTLKLSPSDLSGATLILFTPVSTGSNTVGQYAYCDGVMLEEITQDQYNDINFKPSPYVDGVTCLENPYVEVRHNNLIINGNTEKGTAYWPTVSGTSKLEVVDGKFKITSTSTGAIGWAQDVPVTPNTNYSYKVNVSGTGNPRLLIENYPSLTALATGTEGTFNSGQNSTIRIFMLVTDTGVASFDSIMLVEGTVAPTSYQSCEIERCSLEVKLRDEDKIIYENGRVTGLLNWRDIVLLSKGNTWQFSNAVTGSKIVTMSLPEVTTGINYDSNFKCTKYDGSILKVDGLLSSVDTVSINSTDKRSFAMRVTNSESGWVDAISPSSEEIAAWANGWRATLHDGVRYTSWVSMLDSNVTVGQVRQSINLVSTNISTVYVPNGLKYKVGETVTLSRAGTNYATVTVTSIATDRILVSANVTTQIRDLATGSVDPNSILYVKSTIAPKFEGNKLCYKLPSPEIVTDSNCIIRGEIPTIQEGDNYLYLDNGIVLGELANPYNDGTYVRINSSYPNNRDYLKNKAEEFLAIYKNSQYNLSVWTIVAKGDSTNNGNTSCFTAVANFDNSATYSVDYKILNTISPQVGQIKGSYSKDIITTMNSLQEEVSNRQIHDSTLDTIVDLSVYENLATGNPYYAKFIPLDSGKVLPILVPFSSKKAIPIINIKLNIVQSLDSNGGRTDITSSISFETYFVFKNLLLVRLWYNGSDATIINNILVYGARVIFDVLNLDCRKRI